MNSTDPGAMLTEFHRAIGYPSRIGDGKQPKLVDRKFRASLILEESTETVQALLREDFAGAVDGCIDTIYVCIGSLDRWGVPFSPFFAEVHRANMAKVGGPRREDGKILKPSGWRPPRIAEMLDALSE